MSQNKLQKEITDIIEIKAIIDKYRHTILNTKELANEIIEMACEMIKNLEPKDQEVMLNRKDILSLLKGN